MSIVSVEKDVDRLSLTLVAEFDAPIERVWQLWADPRQLGGWWGPPSHPATVEQHDLTPGGEVTYVMTGPGGEQTRGWWRVTSVDPPRSLEFTDGFAEQDGTPNAAMPTTAVRMRLAEHDGGTRMELRFVFESGEHMERLERWGAFDVFPQSVGQMDALLAPTPSPPDRPSHTSRQPGQEVDPMRKIKANFFISLDGVVESPDKWHFPYFNDEMGAAIGAGAAGVDAYLMGRVLYEEWAAYWPEHADEPFGDVLNETKKHVVTNSLTSADWQNSEIVNGDVASKLAELKAQDGGDIAMSGSATTVRWLLREGLLDELHLLVHPIVVGEGQGAPLPRRRAADPARAAQRGDVRDGVLRLAYAPAK